jgi:sulfur carrier protein
VSERRSELTARRERAIFLAVRVTINGEPRDIPASLTLAGLVEHLGLTDGPVAIERNREVVPRAEHGRVVVEPDDVLEIVHFVGGG